MGEKETTQQQRKEGFFIDTASIPEHVQVRLAYATAGMIHRIARNPEKWDELKARVAARKEMERVAKKGAS